MTADSATQSAIATSRFGFGAWPGERAAARTDAKRPAARGEDPVKQLVTSVREQLQPHSTDLRAVAKGPLRDHLGLADRALADVFPGSERVPPVRDLTRA
ncbi:MAG TPA: hypothetical protein VN790_05190 [Steroidobacteraceae bacterium]|nr:hypothetical protein [Steroidobacteraceae bacterium]